MDKYRNNSIRNSSLNESSFNKKEKKVNNDYIDEEIYEETNIFKFQLSVIYLELRDYLYTIRRTGSLSTEKCKYH